MASEAWSAPPGWEAVIGLEVHAQLRTDAKLFSSAPNAFGGDPNTHTTEVDLGMPGVLPVLNRAAVELALRAALALRCDLQPLSIFARKHYFYPDLPKGYQISQYEEPYALGGAVPVALNGAAHAVPLTRIHMEEDAGKMIHDDAVTGAGVSHVDLNRSGVPLIEIVSEPALRTPAEAGAYLRSLRSILRTLEVSDADMEKGHLRCDGNVSVRRLGETALGTKVELKNLNSFRFLEKAIAHEVERQIDVLEDGGSIVQETRLWDERRACTRSMRSKEYADDYRYFPDPDLIPLRIDPAWIDELRAQVPELPLERCSRFERELGLAHADAQLLSDDRELADFFEATLARHADAKRVANWIKRSLLEVLGQEGGTVSSLALTPELFSALLDLVAEGKLTAASGREVFHEVARSGRAPADVMRERGLEAVAAGGELESLVAEIIGAHPEQVQQLRAGDDKVQNFLIGQVMKRTRGKANPAAVRELLSRLLSS